MWWILMWNDNRGWTFHYTESVIMDYGLTNMQLLDSINKMLTDGLEWCGLLVDYCDVFISCLDSHSDGTHSLQRMHWWASDGILHFFKSVSMNKQTYLHLGWPEGEYIFQHIFIFQSIPLKLWLCSKCFFFFFKNLVTFSSPIKFKLHVE